MNNINVRELRIGNLIKYDNIHDVTVFSIDMRGDIWSCGSTAPTRLENKKISWIPINSDILENWCGFTKVINGCVFHKEFGDEKTLVTINHVANDFCLSYYGTQIKYLHELQNLFYAITKTELPIKIVNNGG